MAMENRFSSFNLAMLNLWIGLCRGEAGLPRDIRHLGYGHKWIEHRFTNSKEENVKPDLIIASERSGHTVLLEWKEGANTDQDQLRRYGDVTPDDLIAKAYLSREATQTHDTCVVGLEEHGNRLGIGLDQSDHTFPLIVVKQDGLSLQRSEFARSELSAVFSPKLLLDIDEIPTHLVPFDHGSDDWEIAEHLIPQIVEYMCNNAPRFTLSQVARDCVPMWENVMSPSYQKRLKPRVRGIIDEAARCEFRDYIERDTAAKASSHETTWKITYIPSADSFDKRSRVFQKMKRKQEDFIEALRTGKRMPEQLSLDL